MINFIIAAEIRVIFLNTVITVRADGDDFLYAIAIHYFYISLSLRLEQIFISTAHSRIAAAAFFSA